MKILKKIFSILMIVALMLTAAPLEGFVGMDLHILKASCLHQNARAIDMDRKDSDEYSIESDEVELSTASSGFLSQETAEKFASLFLSSDVTMAEAAVDVLTGKEPASDEILQMIVNEGGVFLCSNINIPITSNISLGDTVDFVSNIMSVYKNIQTIKSSNSAITKCVSSVKICFSLLNGVFGVTIPPQIKLIVTAIEVALPIFDYISAQSNQEFRNIYEGDLMVAYYTNSELPEPPEILDWVSKDQKKQLEQMYYTLYLEYYIKQSIKGLNKTGFGDEIPVEDITLNQDRHNIFLNEEAKIKVTFFPENATDKTIYYSSTNSNITVSSSGVITAKKAGTATIMAQTSNGISEISHIEVFPFSARLGDNGYYLLSYNGSEKNVIIPDYIDNNPVTEIGSFCVRDNAQIESLFIPDTVTKISGAAINKCSNLSSIIVDSKNTVYNSKNNCNAIIKTNTGELVCGCNYTVIPDGVTKIGYRAFDSCSGLVNVKIPDTVVEIDEYAFYNCIGIKELSIPCSAAMPIGWDGENVFFGCKNIEKVTLTKGTGAMTDYGDASSYNRTRYHYTPWNISEDKIKEIIIEDGVESIGSFAFWLCTGLKSISIPDSVKSIGGYAFSDCENLSSVSLGNGVQRIGESAFSYCCRIKSIIMPESLRTIQSCAFSGCSGLKDIVMNEGLNYIGDFAFSGCTAIRNIRIPDSVSSLGASPFSVVNNVIFSSNMKVTSGKPWEAKCLNGFVDGNMVYSDSSRKKLCGCYSDTIGKVIIPDSVTSIGDYAFYDCKYLTSINIPDGVIKIGNDAFYNCESLTSIKIPNGVTKIGESAFSHCESLSSMTIPASVTQIGDYAFYENKNLKEIVIPQSVTTIGKNNFENYTTIVCDYPSAAYSYAVENNIPYRLTYLYELKSNSSLTVDDSASIVYGFDSGFKSLSDGLSIPEGYTFSYDDSLDRVYTGMSISICDGYGQKKCEYTAVNFGDVNGDGLYNGMDAVILSCIAGGMLTEDDVGTAVYMAADCNQDGVVNDIDIAMTENAGIKLSNIHQNGKYYKNANNKFTDEITYEEGTEFISDIYVASSRSSGTSAKDDLRRKGYTVINYDLNKGAGGYYVYMGYKTTTDYNDAIKDIRFYSDEKDINWSSIDLWFGNDYCNYLMSNHEDLNMRAGGDYIYAFYSKNPVAGPAITSISFGTPEEMDGKKIASVLDDSKTYADLNANTTKHETTIYCGLTDVSIPQ